jgi:hypothetical protein
MKKIIIIMVVLSFGLTLVSNAQKKVALTTFWVKKYIGFDQLDGPAALATQIMTLSENPNFDLTSVLDNFYETFTKEYSKEFPFELMTEEEILKSESYMTYEPKWDNGLMLFKQYLTPKDYKVMTESLIKGENSNSRQMLKMFPNADGVMFVTMGYDFVKKTVPFTAGVRAFVKIKLWNQEGKKVFSIREYGTSKKSVAIVGGIPIMKPSKLLPLCESASEKLVSDLSKKIGKVTKKAAKKL